MAERARLSEAMGYDSVATQEDSHDPFLPLTIAAGATRDVRLETRVAICFPRSPMVMAYTAWDLQAYSEGRFQLGLATQVKGHNLRRFSIPWSSPGPRLREYIQGLHAVWDCYQNGTPLNFQGQHYTFTLMTPAFNQGPLSYPRPRVYIGAVGPYNCRLAGELCDGVIVHVLNSTKYICEVMRPAVEEGARKAGRNPRDIKISGGGLVATGANKQEVQAAKEQVRQRISFQASARTYTPILQVHGWEEVVSRLHALSMEGKWSEMPRQVGDEMVDAFAIVGEYDEIAGKMKERFGGLIDEIGPEIHSPRPLNREMERKIVEELKA